jgi:ubiquinone/menaquinone biosynthesis C-methylase UbiE
VDDLSTANLTWRKTLNHPQTDTAFRVQEAYDQLALVYAQSNHGTMPADLEQLGSILLKRLKLKARIIDVGCGTGRDLAWFESHGMVVIGVDRSAGMIALARRASCGSLAAMEMRQLAFNDHSFDAGWCCASLLHLPKAEAPVALAEMHRVLKRRALLMLSMQEGEGEQWEPGYDTDNLRLFARYSESELVTMLNQASFTVIEQGRQVQPTRTWLTFVCEAR